MKKITYTHIISVTLLIVCFIVAVILYLKDEINIAGIGTLPLIGALAALFKFALDNDPQNISERLLRWIKNPITLVLEIFILLFLILILALPAEQALEITLTNRNEFPLLNEGVFCNFQYKERSANTPRNNVNISADQKNSNKGTSDNKFIHYKKDYTFYIIVPNADTIKMDIANRRGIGNLKDLVNRYKHYTVETALVKETTVIDTFTVTIPRLWSDEIFVNDKLQNQTGDVIKKSIIKGRTLNILARKGGCEAKTTITVISDTTVNIIKPIVKAHIIIGPYLDSNKKNGYEHLILRNVMINNRPVNKKLVKGSIVEVPHFTCTDVPQKRITISAQFHDDVEGGFYPGTSSVVASNNDTIESDTFILRVEDWQTTR